MREGRLTSPGEESVHNGVNYRCHGAFDSERAKNEENGYPCTCNCHIEYADAGDERGWYYATKHARAVQDGNLNRGTS